MLPRNSMFFFTSWFLPTLCAANLLVPSVQAHTCNPSYSEGRDQEDCSLKPDYLWANSLRDPIWKKKSQKKGWWSGSRCSSNPRTAKKKKSIFN
jgi:hypothetical protein